MRIIESRIIDPAGIHARPASLLVKEASQFKSEIDLEVDDMKVKLKSILGIMSLGVEANTDIKIFISGTDEIDAELSIRNFLKTSKLT